MPVNVPEESKTYTTIYDGFRGVDYTNDASNVWRKRSPSGVNMLPDLDGKPYKRSGWKIQLSAEDFKTAAGISSDSISVTPDKMYYFELGGYDHIILFNNLGVFSYTTDMNGGEDMTLRYHNKYVDPSGTEHNFPPSINGTNVPIDSRRAFFFEGRGKAGFYIFVGLKLFRYDGGALLIEEEPYIPTVFFACDVSGAGTQLESVNMLTRYITVRYLCDGTSTTYTLPGGLKDGLRSSIKSVERLNAQGEWVNADSTISSQTSTSITFTTAPPITMRGEDNLRVTYLPNTAASSYDVISASNVDRPPRAMTLIERQTQRRVKTGIAGEPGEWGVTGTTYKSIGAIFDVSNITIDPSTKAKNYTIDVRDDNQSWQQISSDYFNVKYAAYSNAITLEPKSTILSANPYAKSTTTREEAPTAWKILTQNESTSTDDWTYYQEREVIITRVYDVQIHYMQYQFSASGAEGLMAFSQCSRTLVFGSGIINQVFMTSTPSKNYTTRVWYSAATDPTYFPDTNYIEAGASDTPIMGLMKIGQYLGIIKKSIFIDTSIYLAYPTSFDDQTTYAVKQSINGIGALANGAFNTLNEEPVFLSGGGVMGIDAQDDERTVKNRSFFINKRLIAEPNLGAAVSFVHDGLYYLAVNNNCYVLDGSQKNSWANTKTNLQYECYYLENIPAQCFAKLHDALWFTDFKGNLCRFKDESDENQYVDDYTVSTPSWYTSTAPVDNEIDLSDLSGYGDEEAYLTDIGGSFLLNEDGDRFIVLTGTGSAGDIVAYGDIQYTILSVDEETNKGIVGQGVPIYASWSTLADDDGMVHFFKNLKKKGCVISLMPASDSGVDIYIKADSKEPVFVGSTDAKDYELPFEFFAKKKIKKYKRLQFICENNEYGDGFGLDQIIKTYTVGNYSKRR